VEGPGAEGGPEEPGGDQSRPSVSGKKKEKKNKRKEKKEK